MVLINKGRFIKITNCMKNSERDILERLREKDRNAVKAEQLMREHLEMVRKHLLDLPHHV